MAPVEKTRRRLRFPKASVTVVLSLAGGAGLWGCGEKSPDEPRIEPAAGELDALRKENRLLALELELAGRGSPYFVLDLQARELTLKSHGATLQEYPLQGVSLKSRRLGGGRTRLLASLDTVWEAARVLPPVRRPRVVIRADTVTPPDPTGAVNFLPPTPEEAVPTPWAFRVRFQGGRGLFFVQGKQPPAPLSSQRPARPPGPFPSAGKGPEQAGWARLWGRAVQWFRREPWWADAVVIELALPPSELGALYRSFPPGAPVLVTFRTPEQRR